MNKTELISSLSEETTFSKRDITRVLESLNRIIVRCLKKGEEVRWSGFFTVDAHYRKERQAKNPATGEFMTLPARYVPRFRASKNLKEMVKILNQ